MGEAKDNFQDATIEMIECRDCEEWKPIWDMWGYTGDGKGICYGCKGKEGA